MLPFESTATAIGKLSCAWLAGPESPAYPEPSGWLPAKVLIVYCCPQAAMTGRSPHAKRSDNLTVLVYTAAHKICSVNNLRQCSRYGAAGAGSTSGTLGPSIDVAPASPLPVTLCNE